VTQLLGLGEQLLKAFLNVVTNTIDQCNSQFLMVEVDSRSYIGCASAAACRWVVRLDQW
jgi:hypothetical protein